MALLDGLEQLEHEILRDELIETLELPSTRVSHAFSFDDRRRVFVLVEEIAHLPVQQQPLVLHERERSIHVSAVHPAPPTLSLAEQREDELADHGLVDQISAEPEAVHGLHFGAGLLAPDDAKIERAAAEVDHEYSARPVGADLAQVTDDGGDRLRAEALSNDACVAIGFADSGERDRISARAAALEMHRMTEAAAIDIRDRQTFAPDGGLQSAAHFFENRSHERDEAHGFAEHGNSLVAFVREQPFDAVEQPARQTVVVDFLAVERERVGRAGQTRPLVVLARRDAGLAEHLRAKLDASAAVALDVLEDGALAYFGAKRSIDVGRGRHHEGGLFERHHRDSLPVEDRDGAVAGAEIEADPYFVAAWRALAERRQVKSRDRLSAAFERRR
jgi:hypothetical protein